MKKHLPVSADSHDPNHRCPLVAWGSVENVIEGAKVELLVLHLVDHPECERDSERSSCLPTERMPLSGVILLMRRDVNASKLHAPCIAAVVALTSRVGSYFF